MVSILCCFWSIPISPWAAAWQQYVDMMAAARSISHTFHNFQHNQTTIPVALSVIPEQEDHTVDQIEPEFIVRQQEDPTEIEEVLTAPEREAEAVSAMQIEIEKWPH